MISPLRILNAWIDHLRLQERCQYVEWQLGVLLREPVILVPACGGGGFDRIFLAQRRSRVIQTLACVRMNCPWRGQEAGDPHLPRIPLPAQRRIARESRVYEQLAPLGLAPDLMARGEFFLANQFLPWPRVSEVLKRSSDCLWIVLPKVLAAVRRMHDAGIVHMDLNCGNLLISPDFESVAMIDFEYAPRHDMGEFDQQRFDFLRLAHNLLKPRRGRAAALKEPQRFVDWFACFAPESGFGLPEPLNSLCFARVMENDVIRNGFENLFGVLETGEHHRMGRSL
jgi:serine/threonine protein kinase